LADALERDGSDVISVATTQSSTTSGLMSAIAFLEVASNSGCDIPERLVCKYVPPDPRTAEAVREYEVFAREANFYRKFAPLLAIRTPRCFASHYDEEEGSGYLILEDCSHMQSRNVIDETPTSVEELYCVVETAARLCASSWDRQWLLDDPLVWRPGQRVWERYFGNQQSHWPEYLGHAMRAFEAPGFADVAERLAGCYRELLRDTWPQDRLSLAHLDFHCGNYFFDPNTRDDPIVLFDWQGQALGRTAQDLANILAVSFNPDLRRSLEREVVRRFHGALGRDIRARYSVDECWSDYQHGILVALRLLPQLAAELDMTSAFGTAAARKVVKSLTTAVMDHGGLAFLERIAERAQL
jgi:hypothetical protein